MFRGAAAINIDAKGRMAMPVRFRELFAAASEGKLVITIDTEESCLMIYPLPEWDIIQAKLEQLPSFNPAARRIQRLLIGHATDVEQQTRPAQCRRRAGARTVEAHGGVQRRLRDVLPPLVGSARADRSAAGLFLSAPFGTARIPVERLVAALACPVAQRR